MGEVFSQVGRQSDFPCQFRVVLVVVLLVVVMLLLCKFDRRKQKRANFFFNLNLYSSFFSWKGERGIYTSDVGKIDLESICNPEAKEGKDE